MDERDAKAQPLPTRDPADTGRPDQSPVPRRGRNGKHVMAPGSRPEKPVLWTAMTLASLAVLIVILFAVISRITQWTAFRQIQQQDRSDTLTEGVKVDSISLGGLTRGQAMALLSSRAAPPSAGFRYTIHVGDMAWFMTQDDLALDRNDSVLVEQAWSASRRLTLGRGETLDSPIAARTRLRDRIRDSGMDLSSITGYQLDDIARYVDGLAAGIDRDPVSASLVSVDFSTRAFTFSEDIPGRRLDRTALTREIAALLDAGTAEAEIEAAVISLPARTGRLRLKNTFGCLEVRSFETETPTGDDPLRAVVKALNGAIIPSGETVSLRGLISSLSVDYDKANVDRFATALFDAGLCGGMNLVERSALYTVEDKKRGLEAHVDGEADLRLRNGADTPLCLLCYYTPLNARGTRGSVTMELYGILRQGGETAELSARILKTLTAGPAEVQVNPDLEHGTALLRREARDGAEVSTLLTRRINGRVYSTDIVCTTIYPPVCRLVETGP